VSLVVVVVVGTWLRQSLASLPIPIDLVTAIAVGRALTEAIKARVKYQVWGDSGGA